METRHSSDTSSSDAIDVAQLSNDCVVDRCRGDTGDVEESKGNGGECGERLGCESDTVDASSIVESRVDECGGILVFSSSVVVVVVVVEVCHKGEYMTR
jgi:hypothetical protein